MVSSKEEKEEIFTQRKV